MENQSEVAKLLESITASYEAAHLALYAPAIVSKHEFITKRMEHIQEAHVALQGLLGSEQAGKLVATTLDAAGGNEEAAG
jgi:hypothetical protein